MNKERPNIYLAHEKRIAFIERAVGQGVLEKMTTNERRQNIGLTHWLGEMTFEQAGKVFPNLSTKNPFTKERIRQIANQFLTEAWQKSNPKLQECYPLEELLIKKPPLNPERKFERVRRLVTKGIADPQEIMSTLNLTRGDFNHTRQILGRRGIEILPLGRPTSKFESEVKNATSDSELQETIDRYDLGFLKRYITSRRQKNEPSLISSLTPFRRQAGFRKLSDNTLFFEIIRKNNIPIRKTERHVNVRRKNARHQTYYFVYAKDHQRIIEALKKDPALQKFQSS